MIRRIAEDAYLRELFDRDPAKFFLENGSIRSARGFCPSLHELMFGEDRGLGHALPNRGLISHEALPEHQNCSHRNDEIERRFSLIAASSQEVTVAVATCLKLQENSLG